MLLINKILNYFSAANHIDRLSQSGALLTPNSETLKADHIKLQQSSAAALDAAVNHQELLERTIKRLREKLSNVMKDGETMQKEREEVNDVRVILCTG